MPTPASYPQVGQRNFAVALVAESGQEVRLQTTPYRHHLQSMRDPHPDTIWFAGDPYVGGVVSAVGGDRPVRVTATTLWDRDPQLPQADARAEQAGLARDGRYIRRWF